MKNRSSTIPPTDRSQAPNGLSVAQASPCAIEPRFASSNAPDSRSCRSLAVRNGTAEFSIRAPRDPARPGPKGARRCRSVPSVRSQGPRIASVILSPARRAAQGAPAARPQRHRSNHRQLHLLPGLVLARRQSPIPSNVSRVALTTGARQLAPASFFLSRSHPRPARTAVVL